MSEVLTTIAGGVSNTVIACALVYLVVAQSFLSKKVEEIGTDLKKHLEGGK